MLDNMVYNNCSMIPQKEYSNYVKYLSLSRKSINVVQKKKAKSSAEHFFSNLFHYVQGMYNLFLGGSICLNLFPAERQDYS